MLTVQGKRANSRDMRPEILVESVKISFARVRRNTVLRCTAPDLGNVLKVRGLREDNKFQNLLLLKLDLQ